MAADPILVVQNDPSDPVGVLGDWLTDAGATLDVRDLSAAATLPPALDRVGGLLVLGGGMGAWEDTRAPWLPVCGRCCGTRWRRKCPHSASASAVSCWPLAAGGRVGPNPDGPEFGAQLVAKRAAAATDPLFGPLPITPDVIQWHQDAITALPAGAAVLATSPTCEVQAFRIGRLAWGVQFHIETTPATVRAWADEDAGALAEYDYDLRRLLARTDAVHADVAETWRPFAAAFAQVVRDPASVRPLRPMAVTLAAPITDPAQIRAALAAQMQAAHGHPEASRLPWPVQPTPDR